MIKRVFVIGASGLLGHSVASRLSKEESTELSLVARKEEAYHPSSAAFYSCDLSQTDRLNDILDRVNPTHIINAAAYTAVDRAESEKDLAWQINASLPKFLAEWATSRQAHLVHISTDYIYNGEHGPYSENDATDALGEYGASKLAGDLAIVNSGLEKHTIFRASVVYGVHKDAAKLNFVTWLIKELQNARAVRIVDDQFGNFSYVPDLEEAIVSAIESGIYGIFNLASVEMMNRYEFSKLIAETIGADGSLITPIKTAEFKQAAKRPLQSGLRIDKFRAVFKQEPTELKQSIKNIYKRLNEKQ